MRQRFDNSIVHFSLKLAFKIFKATIRLNPKIMAITIAYLNDCHFVKLDEHY